MTNQKKVRRIKYTMSQLKSHLGWETFANCIFYMSKIRCEQNANIRMAWKPVNAGVHAASK